MVMSKQLIECGRSLLSLLQDGILFSSGVSKIVHDLQNLKTLQTTPPNFNIDMYMNIKIYSKNDVLENVSPASNMAMYFGYQFIKNSAGVAIG